MVRLALVGIGVGSPEFLTRAAVRALNTSDLILIPRKGEDKGELAELRRMICAEVVSNPATQIIEFDVPVRRAENGDYLDTVDDWHQAVAAAWSAAMQPETGAAARVALLIWGDPSLYDSSLRIAARLDPVPEVEVVPGITAVQALCAAHAIPLNEIGEPFLVTTGRQLRAGGWLPGVDTVAVMLDGACAFQALDDAAEYHIWWGAYLGMSGEILVAGRLSDVGSRIVEVRQAARAERGWIMDTYILKRLPHSSDDAVSR